MSINKDRIDKDRIDRIVASELVNGCPVYTLDGKKLGEVSGVSLTSFKVAAPMQRDYWIELDYVQKAEGEAVTVGFDSRDVGAYKLDEPAGEEAQGRASGELLLDEDEQRAQREQMARELAEQRRNLPHTHPQGEDAPPNTNGTIGEPVEAELERMEEEGADVLDRQLEERGIDGQVRAAGSTAETNAAARQDRPLDSPHLDDRQLDERRFDHVVSDTSVATHTADAALERLQRAEVLGGEDRPAVPAYDGAFSRFPDESQVARTQAHEAGAALDGGAYHVERSSGGIERYLAIGQGAFFVAGGLWPVFHRRSFEHATGPKADFWLVKTVGLLLAGSGAVLMMAGVRRRAHTREIRTLAVASAAALTAIDLTYVPRRRISRIYLLDALANGGWALSWLVAPLVRKLARSEDSVTFGQREQHERAHSTAASTTYR